ncbi:MAG: competence protein ComA, partial [Alphaproteobacteria bacterium]|nr:competence protein ComA [Alphaproteobacteria bacterium]
MPKLDIAKIRERAEDTLVSHLGIEMLDAGEGTAKARMKITARHLAP